MKLGQWLFHQITYKDYVFTDESGQRDASWYDESTRRFIRRFDGRLEFSGKSVLDVGCGNGALCAEATRGGALRIVGVELNSVVRTEALFDERYPELGGSVQFIATDGNLDELAKMKFDLVLSKDAMEHYAQPEDFIHRMARLVKPGGELVIGFGPLWKSPRGGHIDFMTPVPWAHLLFSEKTILMERRRFRPHEHAERFSEIKGGLNKMTLKRFRDIVSSTGLQSTYLATNLSDSRVVKLMNVLSRIRPLEEYFTVSIHSIFRKP